ncbi:MAG: Gfo/Idh/MocA family oxidoreductase [Phycisphaerae bacterium]
MTDRLPVAVVGVGHMGRHHVRKYSEMKDVKLVAVIDSNLERARQIGEEFNVPYATELTPDLGDVAAVSIAVPTVYHLKVAAPLIERGIAMLIEKPLAQNVQDARKIAALAEQHGTIVQVGHTERFNPAVRAVERMKVRPKFVESHRISPFTFRSADIGVTFDMMIHDIDIVLSLIQEPVARVDAVGVNVLGPHEDIVNARVTFAGGAVATLTGSRLATKTERKLRVFSESAYISLDYQKKMGIAVQREMNVDVIKFARERNIEDLSQISAADYVKLVKVEPLIIQDKDALADELETFLSCVRTRQRPPVSAEDGVAAVALAEQIVECVQSHQWDGPEGSRVGLTADIFGT